MKILLADIMIKKDLTTRQVSVLTGVPKTTVNKIANGKICPRLDTLEALAKGLHVHVTDLFDSSYK